MPARVVLLTDGVSRIVRAGPMWVVLKSTSPRNMAAANRLSGLGLVIQAFKSLGREHEGRALSPAEQFLALTPERRSLAFAEAGTQRSVSAVILEKDPRPSS